MFLCGRGTAPSHVGGKHRDSYHTYFLANDYWICALLTITTAMANMTATTNYVRIQPTQDERSRCLLCTRYFSKSSSLSPCLLNASPQSKTPHKNALNTNRPTILWQSSHRQSEFRLQTRHVLRQLLRVAISFSETLHDFTTLQSLQSLPLHYGDLLVLLLFLLALSGCLSARLKATLPIIKFI